MKIIHRCRLFTLLLFSAFVLSGCSDKVPEPIIYEKSVCTANTVYIFTNREHKNLSEKYAALESQLALMLRSSNKTVNLVRSLDQVGRDGVLINIESIAIVTGVRRSMNVYYTVRNNETHEIIKKDLVSSSSFFSGYEKVALSIAKNISKKIVSLTR